MDQKSSEVQLLSYCEPMDNKPKMLAYVYAKHALVCDVKIKFDGSPIDCVLPILVAALPNPCSRLAAATLTLKFMIINVMKPTLNS